MNPLDVLSFNDLQELELVLNGSGLLSRSLSSESLESISDLEDIQQHSRFDEKHMQSSPHPSYSSGAEESVTHMSIVGAAKKRRAQASVNGDSVKIKGESEDAREKRMERNRIQARKTRNKNKDFLKSLQDEINALKAENSLLKNRVKTLEETASTAAATIQENEMQNASEMSDAIVQNLWMNVVEKKADDNKYSSGIILPFPKTFVPPAASRSMAPPREMAAWAAAQWNAPKNH